MVFSNQVAFSLAALSLSGIAILTILRKRNSSLKAKVKGDCGVEIKEGEDFISQLPNELLRDILFRLPTTDSVRTSILSKRWRNLYAYVPLIDFSCFETSRSEPLGYCYTWKRRCTLQANFIKGVDTFLRLQSASSIYSCRLSCSLMSSRSDKLWEWIYSLGKLNIKVLHLDLMCCDIHSIIACTKPEFSVTCKLFSIVPSLVYFRLSGSIVYSTPEIIRPNCLKVLDLDRVAFTPQAISCLLSNCLNLEGLFMENCNSDPNFTLRICGSNLRLKCLVVKLFFDMEGIELQADNLEYFEYFGYNLINFSFKRIPKLERFVLSLPHRLDGKQSTSFSCGAIAKSLPSVPILSLQIYGQYHEMCTPVGFNMLRNVRHLLLGFSMFKPDQLCIASILQMCPLLCEFHLQVEKSSQEKPRAERGSLGLHDQLKKVIFTGFSGTESEMEAVEYLMRSAVFLQKMIISYCFSEYVGCNKWIKKGRVSFTEEKLREIEMLLREHAASENVDVVIEPIYLRGA